MPGPRVVLVRTKDSANVGGAARAMRNFGLTELWLVAPRCRIDERARALASHAEDVLEGAHVVSSLDAALAGVDLVVGTSARSRRADSYRVATPREVASELTADSAVLFGPEDHGLANEELTRCQAQVTIPTDDFASLNLAQAVLVVAYEWWQASGAAASGNGHPPRPGRTGEATASRDQYEAFYAQLGAAMLQIGYTDPPRLQSVLRMFRSFLDRAELSAHELAALRGLASQVSWAAGRGGRGGDGDEL